VTPVVPPKPGSLTNVKKNKSKIHTTKTEHKLVPSTRKPAQTKSQLHFLLLLLQLQQGTTPELPASYPDTYTKLGCTLFAMG